MQTNMCELADSREGHEQYMSMVDQQYACQLPVNCNPGSRERERKRERERDSLRPLGQQGL